MGGNTSQLGGPGRWGLPLHEERELRVSMALGRHTWEAGFTKSSGV